MHGTAGHERLIDRIRSGSHVYASWHASCLRNVARLSSVHALVYRRRTSTVRVSSILRLRPIASPQSFESFENQQRAAVEFSELLEPAARGPHTVARHDKTRTRTRTRHKRFVIRVKPGSYFAIKSRTTSFILRTSSRSRHDTPTRMLYFCARRALTATLIKLLPPIPMASK